MHEQTQTRPNLQLPLSIVGRMDVARLLRELDALNNFLEAAVLREPDKKPKLPKTSRLLDEMLQQNKLDGLLKSDRREMCDFLEKVRTNAPVIHISFSSDPSPLFLQKLIAWLRDNISHLVLLQVGLQPTIGAGCIVRTTNKQFDFSLRQRFSEGKNILIDKLATLKDRTPVPTQAVATRALQPEISDKPITTPLSAQPVVPIISTEPSQRKVEQ